MDTRVFHVQSFFTVPWLETFLEWEGGLTTMKVLPFPTVAALGARRTLGETRGWSNECYTYVIVLHSTFRIGRYIKRSSSQQGAMHRCERREKVKRRVVLNWAERSPRSGSLHRNRYHTDSLHSLWMVCIIISTVKGKVPIR